MAVAGQLRLPVLSKVPRFRFVVGSGRERPRSSDPDRTRRTPSQWAPVPRTCASTCLAHPPNYLRRFSPWSRRRFYRYQGLLRISGRVGPVQPNRVPGNRYVKTMTPTRIEAFEQSGSSPPKKLLTVNEVADLMDVSSCCVRRHAHELPVVRLGRLLRFDQSLVSRKLQATVRCGNTLKPSGEFTMLQLLHCSD